MCPESASGEAYFKVESAASMHSALYGERNDMN